MSITDYIDDTKGLVDAPASLNRTRDALDEAIETFVARFIATASTVAEALDASNAMALAVCAAYHDLVADGDGDGRCPNCPTAGMCIDCARDTPPQPREHTVPCARCQDPTWSLDALCPACGGSSE